MWGQGDKHLQRLTPHCTSRGSSAPLHKSKLRTLLLMPPGLKESHYHKGLKLKEFRKGFLQVASGYGPTDGYRNTGKMGGSSFIKKEQVTIFSALGKAKLLRAHTGWSGRYSTHRWLNVRNCNAQRPFTSYFCVNREDPVHIETMPRYDLEKS